MNQIVYRKTKTLKHMSSISAFDSDLFGIKEVSKDGNAEVRYIKIIKNSECITDVLDYGFVCPWCEEFSSKTELKRLRKGDIVRCGRCGVSLEIIKNKGNGIYQVLDL